MPRKSNARDNAIAAAIRLFQLHGYHGTGLASVLELSGAPKGSFYHHFPGGKEELAAEAVAWVGRGVQALVAAAEGRPGGAGDFVRTLGRGLSRWLEATGYAEGCPVAALTLEISGSSPRLRDACREAYDSWRELAASALVARGCPPRRAAGLAALVVSGFEGALLLGAAERGTAAIESVAEEIAAHVEAVVASGG